MPPRFWSARHSVRCANRSASATGTSGAPCPPAATSRVRKFEMTSMPVSSAMTAGSPVCHVECPGSCQSVCPCVATAVMSRVSTCAARITSSAASASQRPTSKFRRQYSSGAPDSMARSTRSRCSAVYGVARCATSSARSPRNGCPEKRTTAAEMPSADVPDMSPTIMRAPSARAPVVPAVTPVTLPAAARLPRRVGSRRRARPARAPPPLATIPTSASRSRSSRCRRPAR